MRGRLLALVVGLLVVRRVLRVGLRGGGELVRPLDAVRRGVADHELAVRLGRGPAGGGAHDQSVEVALPGVGTAPHRLAGRVHDGAGDAVALARAHLEHVRAAPVLGEPFDARLPPPQDGAVGGVLQQVPLLAVGADEEGIADRVDAHSPGVAQDLLAGLLGAVQVPQRRLGQTGRDLAPVDRGGRPRSGRRRFPGSVAVRAGHRGGQQDRPGHQPQGASTPAAHVAPTPSAGTPVPRS